MNPISMMCPFLVLRHRLQTRSVVHEAQSESILSLCGEVDCFRFARNDG